MTLWLTLIAGGVLTYAIRLSFIVVLSNMNVPESIRRALRFVPAAVLSAIILPEMVRPGGELNLSPLNPRLLAGLIAGLVAWRTKNILLTIAVGMGALWLIQAFIGS
jgi:branched-subunit amino acid transport protein